MTSQIFVLAFIYLPLLINFINGLKSHDNLQQFIATEKIQAEFYTSSSEFQTYSDCTQDPSIIYLGELSVDTSLEYAQMGFGIGVQSVSFHVANLDPSKALNISLHLSSSTAIPFLTAPINFTGNDKCAFVTVDVVLQIIPSGTQNLYITFPSGEGGQLFLDWFQFNQTSRVIPATERIQAEDYDYQEEVDISKNCSDVTIVSNGLYNFVEFYQVDFGAGVQSVSVRVSSTSPYGGTFSFHIGSSTGAYFAKVTYNYTGGSCNFTELSADVTTLPTGVQNLFLVDSSAFFESVDSFIFFRGEGQFNATEKIEAEDYTSASNVSLYADCSDLSISYVGGVQPTSQLEYDAVDFDSGVEAVTLRVCNIYAGSALQIALRLGTSTSTPFVTVHVGQTGTGSCDFYTMTVFLDARPSGVQKLFLTFSTAQGRYVYLDWFQFVQTVGLN